MTDQEIDAFFDQYVYAYMCHDIEQCIQAKVGVALMLLSYTELIGGLSTGDLGKNLADGGPVDAGALGQRLMRQTAGLAFSLKDSR